MRRIIGWLVDIAAYVLFAFTFWLVALFVDIFVYWAACSVIRTCVDPASNLPFDALSSAVAGYVAMLAACTLLRAIHPRHPAGVFVGVSTCFTLLFAITGLVQWQMDAKDPYELNNYVRFTLGPVIGCGVGWWLVGRRGLAREA